MATFKCNDPVYTVLRNGKIVTMPTTPSNAIDLIIADALNVTCPPECCITDVSYELAEEELTFTVTVDTSTSIGMWIRVHDEEDDVYTDWQHITSGSTEIDLSGLGLASNGDDYCVEFSYNKTDALEVTCCFTMILATLEEDATYDLAEYLEPCTGGEFVLIDTEPPADVTLDGSELTIPELAEGTTINIAYKCSECVSAFFVITATNVSVPCCVDELVYDGEDFTLGVTNTDAVGWYVRVNLNESEQTEWQLSDGDDTIDLSVLTNTFADGDEYCIEFTEDPEADPVVIVPGTCCVTIRAATYIENDTYDVSALVQPCEDGVFGLEYQDPAMGVTVDADGEMVVPDLDEDGTVYVTFTCDDCITDFLVLSVIEEPVGLRMVFNDISQVPLGITDPSDVAEWNTLFNLPTNGTPFASVVVSGNQVTLVGGVITSVSTAYLLQATVYGESMIEIEDQSATIEVTGTGMLYGNGIVTATLPSTITGAASTFQDNIALETALLANATTVGNQAFKGCVSATLIDLTSCVNLGNDPTDASVFNGITGQVITLNIAAVNATNNGGGVHASVAYLIANNTATVNYI